MIWLAVLLSSILAGDTVVVTIETSLGSIDVEIDQTHAPITAAASIAPFDSTTRSAKTCRSK